MMKAYYSEFVKKHIKHDIDLKNSLDTAEEEGYNKGIEKGIAKGIEKGIAKGIEKVAKNMLDKGEPIDKIIEFTGLTREEINFLQSK